MKKLIALVLALIFMVGLVGCSKTNEGRTIESTTDNIEVGVITEPVPQTEPTIVHTLDCKTLQAACAESFIDPSKVTVLGGEWAYTADPKKFVALATVQYTDKDDEYVVAEIAMVGTFDGKTELFHHLNEHSPYTKENILRELGAIDDQRFPLK